MLTYRIQLADGTYLQADKQGDVLLQIRDVLYQPQDMIPSSVFPILPVFPVTPKAKQDARSYVLTCCIYEYGPNHRRWPELARSFVDEDAHLRPSMQEKTLKSSA